MTARIGKLLKLRRDQLALFTRAAEALGASTSAFIVEAATARALAVLGELPAERKKPSKP